LWELPRPDMRVDIGQPTGAALAADQEDVGQMSGVAQNRRRVISRGIAVEGVDGDIAGCLNLVMGRPTGLNIACSVHPNTPLVFGEEGWVRRVSEPPQRELRVDARMQRNPGRAFQLEDHRDISVPTGDYDLAGIAIEGDDKRQSSAVLGPSERIQTAVRRRR